MENKSSQRSAILRAPLCPAGHLPHLRGDWPSSPLSPITTAEEGSRRRSCRSPPKWGDVR
ncbi:MAG: hypothetical protein EOS84_16030 [Mesorhizobium sp.]|nr:MAG: hypothetical protein EOS84_16030 [Mesorhizobium sp.]